MASAKSAKSADRRTGTREWSEHSVNCCTGCRHACLYCYARANALRFGRTKDSGQWDYEMVRTHDVERSFAKLDGVVMFPTTHDITPPIAGGCPSGDGGTLEACLIVLRKLLAAGNQVLIVSKPHRECIEILCDALSGYRTQPGAAVPQVEFRFSITTLSAERAAFWEPGAPPPAERLDCLGLADMGGYRTSVSCEPLLDCHVDDAVELVRQTESDCSGEVWIGCMNRIRARTDWYRDTPAGQGDIRRCECVLDAEIERLEAGYRVENLRAIYERLKGNPKVRWKDSIQKALGLNGPTG